MKIALAIISTMILFLGTSFMSAMIYSWGFAWKKDLFVLDRPYAALGLFILFVICVGIAVGPFISIPLKKLGYIN